MNYYTFSRRPAGEENFVPLAPADTVYYGDTVKIKLAEDMRYGSAQERVRIALKGALKYYICFGIYLVGAGNTRYAVLRTEETTANPELFNGQEYSFTLNTSDCFSLATDPTRQINGFQLRVSGYYRAYCEKYLGGNEEYVNEGQEQEHRFTLPPYTRDFDFSVTLKNVWDPVNHRLVTTEMPFAQALAAGYEGVYPTAAADLQGLTQTQYKITVENIDKGVPVAGRVLSAASNPAVCGLHLCVTGPDLTFHSYGTALAPVEGTDNNPVYESGWCSPTAQGEIRAVITDSTGTEHVAEGFAFGEGTGKIPLCPVSPLRFASPEGATAERCAGPDVNGAKHYDGVNVQNNTYIRVSGIVKTGGTVPTLLCDSRSGVQVFASLRTEGMTDFGSETPLTDAGDARGFHGVIGGTLMTKAYFVRVRAVDCYGQQASIVRLSTAPLALDFPTVFKANAKTRSAEFWWPVTFKGGMGAVQTDEQGTCNLADWMASGLYYTRGNYNGNPSQVVYLAGNPAPFTQCALLVIGNGEDFALQYLFYPAVTENGVNYGCELRRVTGNADNRQSVRLWRK